MSVGCCSTGWCFNDELNTNNNDDDDDNNDKESLNVEKVVPSHLL